MKNCYFLFFVILFCKCATNEEVFINDDKKTTVEIASIQTLGGAKNDVLQSVTATKDGGYITTGYTQSNNGDITTKTNESFDFWVLKFSADNTLLWSKTYGGLADDRGADIIETSDNGYAVLGYSKSIENNVVSNSSSQDFWMLKLDASGAVLWQKSIGFSGADYGTKLIETKDNGYLLTGVLDVTASEGQGNLKSLAKKHAGGDFWAIKLDALGNIQWSKFFGGSFTDIPLGVVQTSKGNFIIAGSSDSNDIDITNNKGSYDFWVIKISETGILIWEKSFGGSEIDEARAIVATNDNHFMIVGDTRSTDRQITKNNGGADIWLLKIDANGTLIWQKTIGAAGFDVARAITKTKDNGFVIAGSSRSLDNGFTNKGQNDALLIKVNAAGNVAWQQTIGGAKIDFLYAVTVLNNGKFVAVGESGSADKDIPSNQGFSDALIIKTE